MEKTAKKQVVVKGTGVAGQPKISATNRLLDCCNPNAVQKQTIAKKHGQAEFTKIPMKGWYFA